MEFNWFDVVVLGLEERLRAQNNSNTNKPLTTRVTTSTVKSTRHTFKDEKIESHTDKNGVCYKIGGKKNNSIHWKWISLFFFAFILDHVYLETNKQAEPYSIASILDFRLVS
jgi:hypothetical protein